MKPKILVVEDDLLFFNTAQMVLEPKGLELFHCSTPEQAIVHYRANSDQYAVVLMDYNLSEKIKGSDVAETIARLNPRQRIVFCTGEDSTDVYGELLRTGLANGFIQKGEGVESFEPVLTEVSKWKKGERVIVQSEATQAIESEMADLGWISRNSKMYGIFRTVKKIRDRISTGDLSSPVLLLGNTGAGKELVAKTIAGNKKLFVVDCSKYQGEDDKFLETELFGAVKGAYTGCDRDRDGVLKNANGNVVFLDEFHLLSKSSQNKLLRALETKQFSRLGESTDRLVTSDFQVVAAANPKIMEMVRMEEFKLDLFQRISVQSIRLSDLNEREEDIEPLALHFLGNLNEASSKEVSFRASAISLMESFEWIGNVRQLRNAVDWMFYNTDGDFIEAKNFQDWKESPAALVGASEELQDSKSVSYKEHMKKEEKKFLIGLLSKSHSQAEAAKRGKMSKSSFCEKLKSFEIDWQAHVLQS